MMFGYLPPFCEIVERTVVFVGEVFLKRFGHDYDHPLPEDLTRHARNLFACPCGVTKYVDGSERSVNESAEEFQREHAGHTADSEPPPPTGYTLEDVFAMKAENDVKRWGPSNSSSPAQISQRGVGPAEVSSSPPAAPSAGVGYTSGIKYAIGVLQVEHRRLETLGLISVFPDVTHTGAVLQKLIDRLLVELTRNRPLQLASETGQDMGVSLASEFFPQHQKHQK